ncbi:hypothetical protein D9M70_243570 [compost metagenome]
MIEPGSARSMAIWKASRSDSRCAAGSITASSQWRFFSLALSEKCLTMEITPSPWVPLMASAATAALSSGSSERYSKLRPLRGSRVRFMPPPSSTLKPLDLASRPSMAPVSRASSRLKLEARARLAGSAVAVSPSR